MQLFRMESSDTTDKVLPRAAQISTAIGSIYFILTAICAIAYWLAGMPGFDAIAHAMTTIATGGFSTSNDSLGAFATPSIEWIAVVFMIVGSLPFVLYLQVVRGRPMSLFRDSQVRWFLSVVLALVILVVLILSISQNLSMGQSIRLSAFNTISILTGTGYSTAAFDNWGPLALTIFFLIMFVGGCAGSTTCGIKIFRFQILYETATAQIRRLVQPHGVFIPYYNRSPITDEVTMSVMSFFFFYVLVFVVLALGLSALGLDFLSAMSGAATAISNVGPGLGPVIGPSGTFASLPDAAKWLLSAGMLLGRLELFTILVLFAPAFWKP
jgi:trk system potassium uptake protein TrkH